VSVRWLIWTFLSPSQILVGSVALGGLLLATGRDRAGKFLAVVGGCGLLVFAILPTAHLLGQTLELRFPQPELPARITGIILLSGAERPRATRVYGQPQLNWAAARYTTALRLSARHPEATLVFSGGPAVDPKTGRPGQTWVARQLLGELGRDPAGIRYDERSIDTCDNAANTRALVQPRAGETWVLVTSAIHMPRAMACFRAVGWEVVPQPADYKSMRPEFGAGALSATTNLGVFDTALHEWLGLAFYRMTGRTQQFFPAPADPQSTLRVTGENVTERFDPAGAAP
jgi:uncharacterized SAM-binding protein YcdF (DUF218 family)